MKPTSPSADRGLIALFSRVTSGGKILPTIDGLRFIAILTVVLHHLNTQVLRVILPAAQGMPTLPKGSEVQPDALLSAICHRGGVGVLIFFSISGFILGLPFARYYLGNAKAVSLGSYFVRRVTRLEPPYIIAVLAMFAVLLVYPPDGAQTPSLGHLFATLAYLHYPIYGELSPILGVTWTLEIEVQFYVLAPLLAMLFSIRPAAVRRTAILALIVAFAILKATMDDRLGDFHLALTVVGYLHCFLIGFLFADFFVCDWSPAGDDTRGSSVADFGCAMGLAMLLFPGEIPETFRVGLYVVGCPLLLYGSFKGILFPRFLSNPWIYTIGGMCYTIYLLHYPILYVWVRLIGIRLVSPAIQSADANLLIQFAACIPILALACGLFFLLIERPCMRKDWPQRLGAFVLRAVRPGRAGN
jgi:peptidoglycan/LPS O-acetylase OafA/YrhL